MNDANSWTDDAMKALAAELFAARALGNHYGPHNWRHMVGPKAREFFARYQLLRLPDVLRVIDEEIASLQDAARLMALPEPAMVAFLTRLRARLEDLRVDPPPT